MGTKLKNTWAAGEKDGLAAEVGLRAGQGALDWGLRTEHRHSVPRLGTESSCSGWHSAASVQEALISHCLLPPSDASSSCCDKGYISVLQDTVTFVMEQV